MMRNEGLRPGYLSLNDAAAWAGLSPRTLRRWMARGLPTYQAGPREKVLVRPEDIDAFLQRRQPQKQDLDRIVDEVIRDLTSGPKASKRAKRRGCQSSAW